MPDMVAVCIICKEAAAEPKVITSAGKWPAKPRTITIYECGNCGHVGIPDNTGGYETAETFAEGSKPSSEANARVGDGERPGREYRMFEMAAEILGRDDLDVLIYGAGLSPDYKLAQKRKDVRKVAVTDVDNFMKTPDFIGLDAKGKFDIVVACEVVEHFTDPLVNFENLLGFVKHDGLLVCSTNVHNGGRVDKLKYPFIEGHTSYYSGGSIREIAHYHGVQFDFRVPAVINGIGGPRKRYIFMHRQPALHEGIAVFFAKHPYAFSE